MFKKIDDIIEGFNPINIQYEYIEDKDIFKYNINLNVLNQKYQTNNTKKNGTVKIMTQMKQDREIFVTQVIYVLI